MYHVIIKNMVRSFKCEETEKIWNGAKSRKLPANIQERALRKLRQLNVSFCLQDLRVPPSNHLKQLSGSKKDQYSIRINDQWRICFEWQNNDSYEVEIIDYH